MDFRNSVSFTALLKAFALCKAGATAVEYTVGALAIGVVAVSAAQNMNTGIKGTAGAEFSGLSYVAPHEDTPAIETCDKCETPPYVPPIDNGPMDLTGTKES